MITQNGDLMRNATAANPSGFRYPACRAIATKVAAAYKIGADLYVPEKTTVLVMFAHDSGSSRFSSHSSQRTSSTSTSANS